MKQIVITEAITPRNQGTLNQYLQDLAKENLISSEKEIELFQNYQEKNDRKYLNDLVRANLRFAVSVAKQYQGCGLDISDLVSEANYGLIKAAEKFDATKGFKFISYAVWWIRQSIIQCIAEHARTIRIPLNKLEYIRKYNKLCAELEQELNYFPSDEQIIEKMKIEKIEYSEMLAYSNYTMSLDAQLSNDNDDTFGDIIKCDYPEHNPSNNLMIESQNMEINSLLNSNVFGCFLTKTEQTILKMFFGIGFESPMLLEEISMRVKGESKDRKIKCYTKERIRQMKENALDKLWLIKQINHQKKDNKISEGDMHFVLKWKKSNPHINLRENKNFNEALQKAIGYVKSDKKNKTNTNKYKDVVFL